MRCAHSKSALYSEREEESVGMTAFYGRLQQQQHEALGVGGVLAGNGFRRQKRHALTSKVSRDTLRMSMCFLSLSEYIVSQTHSVVA